MAISEQLRLATVEEHVRGENARDMDAVMRTFSDSALAAPLFTERDDCSGVFAVCTQNVEVLVSAHRFAIGKRGIHG